MSIRTLSNILMLMLCVFILIITYKVALDAIKTLWNPDPNKLIEEEEF